MKRSLIIFVSLVLAACSSSLPNLNRTNSPILNIVAELAPSIEAKADANFAWVKNKGPQPRHLSYHLFWYNDQGVTQVWSQQKESIIGHLYLKPQEKQVIELTKPTPESTNYRLYLQ